jgi:hypothetical protein
MGSFGDSISAILSRLAQSLGLKPSEGRRLELMEQKLAAAKASNIDRVDALAEKIRLLESQALRKKKELESSRGDSKRIVAGSIEQLFRDLDRLQGQERIIRSNIERLSIAQAKLQELRVAQETGVEEGQLDDIALDLQEVFAGVKTIDREAADLEQVEYEAPKRSRVDIEQRMAEVEGEAVTKTGLSPETEKRLKQLEAEEA